MQAEYYPVYLSLNDRVCLVVGGGPVGERKIRGLLRSGALIRIVAEQLTPWLESECKDGRFRLVGASYRETQLDDVDMVFVATSNAALNLKIAEDARRRRVWCNMATDPGAGSFIVPSVFQRGPLAVAISTSGLSPAMAREIRKILEDQFGSEWALSLTLIGHLRSAIQAKKLDVSENQRIFRELAALPLADWIRRGQCDQARAAVARTCSPWLSQEEVNKPWDEIWKSSSSL